MKGFKNTTRTQTGHNPSAAGRTVGRVARFAQGGSVPGGINGVADFHSDMDGSSSVKRQVPSSVEDADTGGTSPLRPGYAAGGKSKEKHFHVHNHYHGGKKMPNKSKLKSLEKKATGGTIDKMAKGGKKHHVKKATGGTINRMSAGGGPYATGGTANRLAMGGMPNAGVPLGAPPMGSGAPGGAMPMQGALGNLAAQPRAMPMQPAAQMPMQGAMPGGPSPVMRARGGSAAPKAGRSAAKAAVRAHVGSPAPMGHRGLAKMIDRG